MPQHPRYSGAEAREAILGVRSWSEVIRALGYGIAEGRDPAVVEIPTRTWPNRNRDRRAA
jgi:hypothetical protein